MKTRVCLWLSLLVSMSAGSAVSGGLVSTVRYVTAGTVYIDAGSRSGICVGDRGEIHHQGMLRGRVEVSYVSERSASCALVDSLGPVAVGDSVVLDIADGQEAPKAAGVDVDILSEADSALTASPPAAGPSNPPRVPVPTLDGRIAARFFIQADRASVGSDLSQPSLYLSMRAANVLGTRHVVSIRGRLRQTRRSRAEGIETEWYNRVYEVAFRYDDPSRPIAYSLGRAYVNHVGSLGAVDGMSILYRVSRGLEVTAFGGLRPDSRTSRTATAETAGGLVLNYAVATSPALRLNAAVAAVGTYHSGEIDREYVYERSSIAFGSRLRLLQSAELEIRRGWRKEPDRPAFGLSNMLLNIGFAPGKTLDFTVGYDTRTLDRTYETKDTPDSLFDDSLRQGFRVGARAHLPGGLRIEANGSLGTRQGENENTRAGSIRLSAPRIFGSGITGAARIAHFRNRYTIGHQPSIALSSSLGRDGYLYLDAGISSYDMKNLDTTLSAQWLTLRYQHSVSRHLLAAITGETRRGDDQDYVRATTEIGYRF